MRYLNTAVLCLMLLAAVVASAKTYRWVDDNGVVHYSDSPRPGSADPDADAIELPPTNVIESSRTRAPIARPTREADPEPAADDEAQVENFAYRTLRIVSPSDGDTLWNIGGTMNVGVQVVPRLRPNHGVIIFLDGALATEAPVAGTSITLDDVYRGEHRMTAVVRGTDGQDLITSVPVTFFVQQRSIN